MRSCDHFLRNHLLTKDKIRVHFEFGVKIFI